LNCCKADLFYQFKQLVGIHSKDVRLLVPLPRLNQVMEASNDLSFPSLTVCPVNKFTSTPQQFFGSIKLDLY